MMLDPKLMEALAKADTGDFGAPAAVRGGVANAPGPGAGSMTPVPVTPTAELITAAAWCRVHDVCALCPVNPGSGAGTPASFRVATDQRAVGRLPVCTMHYGDIERAMRATGASEASEVPG
jgi:hypothetical protein